jgi:hypothetical protein
MKSLALIALLLLPVCVHAQAYGSGIDGQTVFQVSESLPPLAFSGTASRALVFPSDTRVIRLTATANAHMVVSASTSGAVTPTITVSNTLLPAFTPEYFKVQDTRLNRYLWAVSDTSAGFLYIDLMKP